MKNPATKKVLSVLGEILCELLLTAVCFAIGFGILTLLGYRDVLENVDSDLIILPGCLVVLAVFGAVIAIVSVIKKNKEN